MIGNNMIGFIKNKKIIVEMVKQDKKETRCGYKLLFIQIMTLPRFLPQVRFLNGKAT